MRHSNTFQRLLLLAAFASLATRWAPAQTVVPFSITVTQGANHFQVGDGGSISLGTDAIGQSTSASMRVTYTGNTTASFTAFQFTGSGDFLVTGGPSTVLAPNDSFTVNIQFTPTTANAATGRLNFAFVESRPPGSTTGPPNPTAFGINLVGTTADFIVTSTVDPNGNSALLSDGSTIQFPQTLVGTSSSFTISIANRGSGPGVVNSISLSGDSSFKILNLLVPLPGAVVAAGTAIRFNVQFTPLQLGVATGTIGVQFRQGQATFLLSATGIGPILRYQASQGATVTPVVPSDSISFPDTAVGDHSNLLITVQNIGNGAAVISNIDISGGVFQSSNTPFLPVTIPPQSQITFTVIFTPTQPGTSAGRLRVGVDSFNLSATGVGPNFTFTYTAGADQISVPNGGTVIFTPIAVGARLTAQFTINNAGNAPSIISSIGVDPSKVFTLSGLPALPLTLAPGASIFFTITFAPNNLGILTGTLHLDSRTFSLSGSGSSPAPLPGYQFVGPTGLQDPLGQPTISLALQSPYSLPLNGTVQLSFGSDVFVTDPALQFATGGTTVGFTIPANATQAVFSNNSTQLKLQVGSVAGTITLSPVFSTEAGLALTPAASPVLKLVVPSSAPKILSAQIDSRGDSSFTLSVVGLATGRNMSQITLQFTPASGFGLSIPNTTLSVDQPFGAWFQSATSQQFGSLFTATIPLNLQGQVQGASSLLAALQSLSITLANREGTSEAFAVPLR